VDDVEQDEADPLGLSEEQADTDRLLRQLLGTAIADRYVDFCLLSSGRLPLIVSRPLAGHALRELDSLIRSVLAVPMDARAEDDDQGEEARRNAQRVLKDMGFDDEAVRRAGDALKPRLSHRTQVERIVTRLGLAADGDIAKLWIELNNAYGRVHERSFHERLEADDAFRAEYAGKFDTVIRAVAVQLQDRYAALMRRAKEIAGMKPAEGIKRFIREIPGAIQLQLYFYENLTEAWLPYLETEGMLGEPLPDAQISSVLRLWGWPVGRYLVRMASSTDAATRNIVERTLRSLKSSTHPDVQRLGLDIIAALPAGEAAALVDVVEGWLTPEIVPLFASPHTIIATLARAGYVEAALRATAAVFQVFQRDGEPTSFFDPTMYEHYLMTAVQELAKAGPLLALPAFCDFLLRASRMDRRLAAIKEEDYSYYMVSSLVPSPSDSGDALATIIRGIVAFADAAIETEPSAVRRVLGILASYRPRIFRRIALHVLAKAPAEAPDLAERFLTDTALIDAEWCREEYGELASAWLPYLPAGCQQRIFAFIDSVPEDFLDTWRASFERHEKRKPGPEDERMFRETTIRDLVWEWRDALPLDRRAAFDRTVAEFGGRDDWKNRYFAYEESSLSRASMQEQPLEDTIAHLASWQPNPEAQGRTTPGLAFELRESATASPQLFSAGAAKFAGLRPVFIRHLLDGLRLPTANGVKIEWPSCFDLLEAVLKRTAPGQDAQPPVPGDDADWSWTLQSGIEWLAVALRRGADGIPFVHADRVQALVLALYGRVKELPAPHEDPRQDRKRPYLDAIQKTRGAAIDLCVLLVSWQSKNPDTAIGQAPREALAHSPEVQAILEAQLQDRTPPGWIPRAVLGRYLRWLCYFGEDWLREQFVALFPGNESDLAAAAWLGHLLDDGGPIGKLMDLLAPYYALHIKSLSQSDAPTGFEEGSNRLAEYLMILYLWNKLPDELLTQFWETAPVSARRHAMWYMGRHMLPNNNLRSRAMAYWEERLQTAIRANDPEPFRRELGTIGQFFLWEVDRVWLADQLLAMLKAGFAPNDAMGVIDNVAKLLPDRIDKVVEVTNLLVRQPRVQAWIFAFQDQSLRTILVEGKKSPTPATAATVKEIVSYLASRGNPSFLDLDD
jgi:hypothetical protein